MPGIEEDGPLQVWFLRVTAGGQCSPRTFGAQGDVQETEQGVAGAFLQSPRGSRAVASALTGSLGPSGVPGQERQVGVLGMLEA